MAKSYSDDFTDEAEKEENRPVLLVDFYLGDENGVWRITSLDERFEIEISDVELLKEP